MGRPGGVALTFDDVPDPQGTPVVLAALDKLGWRPRAASPEVQPLWFRPPCGVLTGGGVAARARDLLRVLWMAWRQDWRRTDGHRNADTVCRDLDDRGMVLLHDSDVTALPGRGALPSTASRCSPSA